MFVKRKKKKNIQKEREKEGEGKGYLEIKLYLQGREKSIDKKYRWKNS